MAIWNLISADINQTIDLGSAKLRTIEVLADPAYSLPFWIRFDNNTIIKIESLPVSFVRRCSSLVLVNDIGPIPPVLSLQVISDTEIFVLWVFSDTTDADQIEIERSTTPGSGFTLVSTQTATGVGSFSDTGRTAGTTYYYRARAKMNAGVSPAFSTYGTEVSATTAAAATPLVPQNVLATETSRTATTITYTLSCDAVATATSYDWCIDPSIDGGYSNGSLETPNNHSGSTFNVTGVVANRVSGDDECRLFVRALNANGPGPWKNFLVFLDGNLKAPILNSVILSGGDDASVTFTEDAEADAVTHNKIERNKDNAGYTVVATVATGAAAPQLVDTNLVTGSHKYRVRGHDSVNDVYSVYSAEKAIVVGAPPPSGYIRGLDFASISTLGDLAGTGFSIANVGNITLDVGVGLKYTFVVKDVCINGNSLTTNCTWAGSAEIWMEFTHTYADNWDTLNPNCASGTGTNPDYKMVLTYPIPQATAGAKRFDFKVGEARQKIHCAGDGTFGYDNAPVSVIQKSSPINAMTLWDGLPHTYRLHYHIFNEGGINKCIFQAMIDGQVTHSVKDIGNPDRASTLFKKINMGANRNQGVVEETYTWWHSFYLWDTDPGWFSGVAILDWADNGGAPYTP